MPTSLISRQFATLTIFTLSASSAWLAAGGFSPTSATAAETPIVLAPPEVDTTKLNMEDIVFQSGENGFLFSLPYINVQLVNSQIEIGERGTKVLIQPKIDSKGGVTLFNSRPMIPFWTGSVSDARFIHNVTGGIDTVKDSNGNVLWTNAAEIASADLLLDSTEAGEATLKGKGGTVLWSGKLATDQNRGSSSRRSNGSYQIDAAGVHVTSDGTTGAFTVTDNQKRVLWSGTLPTDPVILLRRGHRFTFIGLHRGSSGSDREVEVSFGVETGEVTIEDTNGNTVGTRPLDLLKVFEKTTIPGSIETSVSALEARPRFILPRATMKSGMGITLIYKDSTGMVIGRGTVSANRTFPIIQ